MGPILSNLSRAMIGHIGGKEKKMHGCSAKPYNNIQMWIASQILSPQQVAPNSRVSNNLFSTGMMIQNFRLLFHQGKLEANIWALAQQMKGPVDIPILLLDELEEIARARSVGTSTQPHFEENGPHGAGQNEDEREQTVALDGNINKVLNIVESNQMQPMEVTNYDSRDTTIVDGCNNDGEGTSIGITTSPNQHLEIGLEKEITSVQPPVDENILADPRERQN
ncbi:hypothetical protein RND71_013613 [Anisodus tanguticus]|uniref:Uncharacterized protein n=1 Tax=Anisodus tanguticus TaxID=243964 RepID=A0AAE1SAE7_9SOLA|nr:hypothetical protein RND71_013613 [Anisodus tanguticus]